MALTLSRKAQAVKPSSTLAITAKAKELKAQGLTSSSEAFLLAQGPEVLKRIQEPALRNSNPWVE